MSETTNDPAANNPLYETRPRYAGVLFHITSLAGPYGIGDLGKEAFAFADFLESSGASLWQILPLGPTGFGNSPYAARSSFAGNELLISPEILAEEGWLDENDLAGLRAAFSETARPAAYRPVDYGRVEEKKLPVLQKAARAFLAAMEKAPASDAADYKAFREKNAYWLEDYALFQVLCETYHDARWHTIWDKTIGRREAAALNALRIKEAQKLEQWKALQWFFERQWQGLRSYVNGKGIKIVGDIPIFAAPDSVDSWSNIELFQTDADGNYSVVSGVPPDYFSPTGQLWGNPIYNWEKMKNDGYAWWTARIKRLLEQVDIFRIDHFRGFDAYWAVPAGNTTAEHGTWEKGPGEDFFNVIKSELGVLPVLAEDLGFMTEGVKQLRDSQGFPGMKVCQFGFEDIQDGALDARHLFLPHNYSYNWAAYTGTHDNDTTAGWYSALASADKQTVAAYFNCGPASPPADIAWAMIRAVMASHAEYAIFPLQDLLGLGSESRMNTPATCGSHNWSWRLSPQAGTGGEAGSTQKLGTEGEAGSTQKLDTGGEAGSIQRLAEIAIKFRRMAELYGRKG
jgi:4-alpha-glucanotransferase